MIGASTNFFSLQTALLVTLVLVTFLIAISLTTAIVCIRHQHLAGCKNGQHSIPTPTHAPPSYILPSTYPHSDYTTFLKQNGSGPAYMLTKTTTGSVCSSDHCDASGGGGGGGGSCPITDLGVTEFYAPYGLATSSTQGDDQVRFVEVDPTGMAGSTAYLSFARSDIAPSASPGIRLVSAYHPVPASSSGNTVPTQGMLKFRQVSWFEI